MFDVSPYRPYPFHHHPLLRHHDADDADDDNGSNATMVMVMVMMAMLQISLVPNF